MRQWMSVLLAWLPFIAAGALLVGCGQATAPSASVSAPATSLAAKAAADDPAALDKGPILLVHGHDGTERDWDYWKPILEKEGWQPKAITLVTDDWNPEELADQVAMHVQALCRATGRQKIDVLAHSMGGLATRYYIKNRNGDQHIRRLVTLSTPNHGIGFALPARWMTVARFLSPHSAFLNRLNEPNETYGSVLYTCIWSTGDYTQQLPWASGRLKGAFNYVVHKTSHAGMLSDPRLLPAIEQGLERLPGAAAGSEQTID